MRCPSITLQDIPIIERVVQQARYDPGYHSRGMRDGRPRNGNVT